MSRAHLVPITTLVVIVAVPLAWLACGGGTKPAESPASENSASSSSAEATGSDTPAASASSAAPETPAPAATPSTESTAAAAPPPPTFGSTDCGKCIEKSCSKQAAACGKDNDCQATLDTIRGCSQSGAACVDAASAPSAAKSKKLAAAYETCGKKAAAKACKAKCQ